jgi:hypothetical protein
MVYSYICPLCEKQVDVDHPSSETDKPSDETIQLTSCPGLGKCEFIEEGDEELTKTLRFNRDYSGITFATFHSLSPERKKQMLKDRAHVDFKKNIEEKKRSMSGMAIKELRDIVKKK